MPDFIVYGLYHRDRPAMIRYVGITTISTQWRLQKHKTAVRHDSTFPVHAWMRKHGSAIDVRVLTLTTSVENLSLAEIWMIGELRAAGHDLLNVTTGGQQGSHPHTAEARARISAAMKGKPKSAEHRAIISAAQEARWNEIERAKKAALRLGLVGDDAHLTVLASWKMCPQCHQRFSIRSMTRHRCVETVVQSTSENATSAQLT